MKSHFTAIALLIPFAVGYVKRANPRLVGDVTAGTAAGECNLELCFDERGLGNEDIIVTASATEVLIVSCINNGGQAPQATAFTFTGTVLASGTLEPSNGRVSTCITATAITPPSLCQPRWTTVPENPVPTYSNINFVDSNNAITQAATPGSVTASNCML